MDNNKPVFEAFPDVSELPHRRGLCLVLVGPSGSGKTSILRQLASTDYQIRESVSVTTRPMRDGEFDGADYNFITRQAFTDLQAAGGLLEWTEYAGNSYGTLKTETEVLLASGIDLGFVVDVAGCMALQQALPGDVVSVFVQPPSMDEVRLRMLARGDAPAAVERRMETDYCMMSAMRRRQACEHVVINDNLEAAVRQVSNIFRRARNARLDPAVRRAVRDMTPADRVREALSIEEGRLRSLGYDKHTGAFWASFELFRDGLLERMADLDGHGTEAVREACYDNRLGWEPFISFGGYAEWLTSSLAEAAYTASV